MYRLTFTLNGKATSFTLPEMTEKTLQTVSLAKAEGFTVTYEEVMDEDQKERNERK